MPSLNVEPERTFLLEITELLVLILSESPASSYTALFLDGVLEISQSFSTDTEDVVPQTRIEFWTTESPTKTIGKGQPFFDYYGEIICISNSERKSLSLHREVSKQIKESWTRHIRTIESSVEPGVNISVGLPELGNVSMHPQITKGNHEYVTRFEYTMSACQTL